MRAIIIAAGRGSRMGNLTDDGPKGLLCLGGVTMLQRSIDMLREVGILEIVVVRGYRANRVQPHGVTFVENIDWESTDVLQSIFSAKDFICGDVIILYSDIVYSHTVLETAIMASKDIQPVIDVSWRKAYEGRFQHPLSEADKVVLRDDGSIGRIGKLGIRHEEANGEFIGMLRLSQSGAQRFTSAYNKVAASPEAPFGRAATFRRAYLTDLLQHMINNGEQIEPAVIDGGWREVDTQEDLERARSWLNAL